MGGFCLLIFPVKGMISMAVVFAESYLKRIWPYPEKSGPIVLYRNGERIDREKNGWLNGNQALLGGLVRTREGLLNTTMERGEAFSFFDLQAFVIETN